LPTTIEIRPLKKGDERAGFSCGQEDLDRFFQHYAGQNQFKLHLAVTYVATSEDRILGFATVAAASIERKKLPIRTLASTSASLPAPCS